MEEAVLVAKMKLQGISTGFSSDDKVSSERVQLSAVTGPKGSVNEQWSQWTPAGQLDLTINNPKAFGLVKPGSYKVYLVPCGEND
jgi:hypothetical protein